MGARNRTVTMAEQSRQKIHHHAGVLLKRLIDHALGECEMTPQQVRSAEILLKKVLPDLKAIEHSGSDGEPLAITIKQYSVGNSDN